jgi:hypothetical protein
MNDRTGFVADLITADKIATLKPEEVAERLRAGGYRRGSYMENLMASRLIAVCAAIRQAGLEQLLQWEREQDTVALNDWLQRINGVGPTVAATFVALRASSLPNDSDR